MDEMPDGASMVRFSATCRHLWALYKLYVHRYIRVHLIRAYDEPEMVAALYVTAGAEWYMNVRTIDMDAMLANLLWRQHNFNVYLYSSPGEYSVSSFIRSLGLCVSSARVEGFDHHMDQHGNVVQTSDYYGDDSFSRHEERIRRFEWIRDNIFPGTFDWRTIAWPRIMDVSAMGRTFHRGYCTQIIFRSTMGLCMPDHKCAKLLKKTQRPFPVHLGHWKEPFLITDRPNKKRREVDQQVCIPTLSIEQRLEAFIYQDDKEIEIAQQRRLKLYWQEKK
jgi:hypothetical protein